MKKGKTGNNSVQPWSDGTATPSGQHTVYGPNYGLQSMSPILPTFAMKPRPAPRAQSPSSGQTTQLPNPNLSQKQLSRSNTMPTLINNKMSSPSRGGSGTGDLQTGSTGGAKVPSVAAADLVGSRQTLPGASPSMRKSTSKYRLGKAYPHNPIKSGAPITQFIKPGSKKRGSSSSPGLMTHGNGSGRVKTKKKNAGHPNAGNSRFGTSADVGPFRSIQYMEQILQLARENDVLAQAQRRARELVAQLQSQVAEYKSKEGNVVCTNPNHQNYPVEYARLKEQIAQHDSREEQLTKEAVDAQFVSKTLKDGLARSKEQINQLRYTINQMQLERSGRKICSKCTSLATRIDEYRQTLSDNNIELTRLKIQVDTQKQALQAHTDQLNIEHAMEIQALKRVHEQDLEQMQARITLLTTQAQEAQTAVKLKERTISKGLERENVLEQQLANMKKQCYDLTRRVDTFQFFDSDHSNLPGIEEIPLTEFKTIQELEQEQAFREAKHKAAEARKLKRDEQSDDDDDDDKNDDNQVKQKNENEEPDLEALGPKAIEKKQKNNHKDKKSAEENKPTVLAFNFVESSPPLSSSSSSSSSSSLSLVQISPTDSSSIPASPYLTIDHLDGYSRQILSSAPVTPFSDLDSFPYFSPDIKARVLNKSLAKGDNPNNPYELLFFNYVVQEKKYRLEIVGLLKQITELENQDHSPGKVVQLEAEIKKLKTSLTNATHTSEMYHAQLQVAKSALEPLRKELFEIKNKYQVLADTHFSCPEKISSWKKQVDDLKFSYETLLHAHERTESKLNHLTLEHDQCPDMLQEWANQYEDMRIAHQGCAGALLQASQKYLVEAGRPPLEEELHNLRRELKELNPIKEGLEFSLKEAKKQMKKVKFDLMNQRAENERLLKKLKVTQDREHAATTKADTLEQAHARCSHTILEWKRRYQEEHEQTCPDRINQLEETLNRVTKIKNAEIARLQEDMRISSFAQRGVVDQVKEMEVKLNDAQTRYQDARNGRDSWKQRASDLQREHSSCTGKISFLRRKLNESLKKLDESKNGVAKLKAQVIYAEDQLKKNEEAKEALTKKYNDLNSLHHHCGTRIQRWVQEYQKISKEHVACGAEIAKWRESYHKIAAEHAGCASVITSLEDRLSQLQSEHNHCHTVIHKWRLLYSHISKEHIHCGIEKAAWKDKWESLNLSHVTCYDESRQWQQQLEDVISTNSQARIELVKWKGKYHTLKQDHSGCASVEEELTAQIAGLLAQDHSRDDPDIDRLELELISVKKQLLSLTATHTGCDKVIATYKDRNAKLQATVQEQKNELEERIQHGFTLAANIKREEKLRQTLDTHLDSKLKELKEANTLVEEVKARYRQLELEHAECDEKREKVEKELNALTEEHNQCQPRLVAYVKEKEVLEIAHSTCNIQVEQLVRSLTQTQRSVISHENQLLHFAEVKDQLLEANTQLECYRNYKKEEIHLIESCRKELADQTPIFGLQTKAKPHRLGVQISKVREGQLADKSGLKKGDVIMFVNGSKVETQRAYKEAISRGEIGSVCALQIYRPPSEVDIREIKENNDRSRSSTPGSSRRPSSRRRISRADAIRSPDRDRYTRKHSKERATPDNNNHSKLNTNLGPDNQGTTTDQEADRAANQDVAAAAEAVGETVDTEQQPATSLPTLREDDDDDDDSNNDEDDSEHSSRPPSSSSSISTSTPAAPSSRLSRLGGGAKGKAGGRRSKRPSFIQHSGQGRPSIRNRSDRRGGRRESDRGGNRDNDNNQRRESSSYGGRSRGDRAHRRQNSVSAGDSSSFSSSSHLSMNQKAEDVAEFFLSIQIPLLPKGYTLEEIQLMKRLAERHEDDFDQQRFIESRSLQQFFELSIYWAGPS